MKRFALSAVLALTATLALAGNSYLGTLTSPASTGGVSVPDAPTDGFALKHPRELKGFVVTVADVRDGSVGDGLDAILTVDTYAWCYNARNAAPDGGGGWARMAALDVSLRITDGGTGAGTAGVPSSQSGLTAALPGVSPGIDCTRIYYTTGGLNLPWDGGTGGAVSYPIHKVMVSEID